MNYLLKCPVCEYEEVSTHGWAFRSNKDTKCEGLPPEGKPRPYEAYKHPFEVVKEIKGEQE